MKTELGNRLPKFSNEETKLLAGSIEFLAINYYMSYLSSPPEIPFPGPFYLADKNVDQPHILNGEFMPQGSETSYLWQSSVIYHRKWMRY